MSKLPVTAYPIYEVSLLSQKEPIKIRPFTVREEKLMLMAVQNPEIESIINTLKQIMNNCIIGNFDVDNMAMIDMETLFLNLRARSIGEVGHQFFKCQNEITANGATKQCGMLIDVPIKFLEVPIVNKDTSLNIKFSDEVGVKMRYPTFSLFKKLGTSKPEDLEQVIIASCIDMIYDKDSVYYAKDCTQDELIEFLLNLMPDKYQLLKDFCDKVPKTQMVTEPDCKKCGYHHTFTLEGIADFFV